MLCPCQLTQQHQKFCFSLKKLQSRDWNPGRLSVERERYLCAMPTPQKVCYLTGDDLKYLLHWKARLFAFKEIKLSTEAHLDLFQKLAYLGIPFLLSLR